MTRARDLANAITTPEFSGNVEIIGTSPELTFETTNASHYNFQISVQENISGGLEISSGSADADSSNDTFTPRLVVLQSGNVGIGENDPEGLISFPATASNTPKLRLQSTSTNTDFAISSYADANGTYVALGANHYLNSSGNDAVFETTDRSAFILLDARNAGAVTFGTNSSGVATERMRIDSSGKVLVGTSTPASFSTRLFTVGDTSFDDTALEIRSSTGTTGRLYFTDASDTSTGAYKGAVVYDQASDFMRFETDGGNERMRVDSSGNFLVGTTESTAYNNSSDVYGFNVYANGQIASSVNGVQAAYFNRQNSNGQLLDFRKDGSNIGTIGSTASGMEIFAAGVNNCGWRFNDNSAILPMKNSDTSDNLVDLGNSSFRMDDIFATNGTIQTSDENEKNTIVDSDLGLDFIKRLSPKSYKFNNKTRTHYGLIAQDVEAVLSDISKSSTDFAGFIKDDISEDKDGSNYRYGLRYTELIAPMIKALQEANEKIETLEAKVAKLEG